MAFSNSILAGEQLVRTGIRSPNYQAGVQGWRIAQDGSAEFNDVTVRGDVDASGFTTFQAGHDAWIEVGAVPGGAGGLGSIYFIRDSLKRGIIFGSPGTGGGVQIAATDTSGNPQNPGLILDDSTASLNATAIGLFATAGQVEIHATTHIIIDGQIDANANINTSGTVNATGNVTATTIIASTDLRASHDIESLGAGQGVVVHSVNGSRWRMGVTNSGALSIAAA